MTATAFQSLDELLENRVFYHFARLCAIPHASFQEEKISDYLLEWAKGLGLEARRDGHWNVLIKKPGSPGYELAPAVLLQAHTDMVCEKAPHVEHDFLADPIHLVLEGDFLSTGGRTTLGADDGIGVAYAMALLESDHIPHPPLEVLLTTAEEEDLSGAMAVDGSWLSARLLINLDHSEERTLIAGSCGGMGAELTLPVELQNLPGGYRAFRAVLSGLPGGHSGGDIARGHGNANVLLGRLLCAWWEEFPFFLGELAGGSFRLAIPREAQAVVLIDSAHQQALRATAARMAQAFRLEYAAAAPALSLTLEEAGYPHATAAPPTAAGRLITAIGLSPNGISEMHHAVPGVVESSDNLGELRLEREKGRFVLVYEIRAAHASTRDYLGQKLRLLARQLEGEYREFAHYPSWTFTPGSELRRLAEDTYRREYGKEIKTVVVHEGLECGCLFPKLPGLDAISIGPDTWGLHSPQERLSVSSAVRVFEFLKALLARMR